MLFDIIFFVFIRQVSKTVKNRIYLQGQLIESIRTPSGPRQRLVLNLGQLKIPKEQFKNLANRIEEILTNHTSLFETLPEVEALAQHYAERIRQQGFNNKPTPPSGSGDIQSVDIDSLVHSQARTLGGEHVVLEQMKEYCFAGTLKEQGFADHQIDYAQMLVLGRMLFPGSERRTVRWVEDMSACKELLKTPVRVYDNALHRAAVKLWENHQAIESALSRKAKEIFSLKEMVILYDLTNTYFEGSKRESKITSFGHSKERRNDRPLITLALVVDDEGFPKQSRIFPGKPDEPASLETMLEELKDKQTKWFSQKKTIVIDAGIASEENLVKIKACGMSYVAISRKKTYDPEFWEGSPKEEVSLADKSILKVHLVKTETELFLLCESESKKAKEEGILNRRLDRFERGIAAINKGLKSKRSRKKYEEIVKRIGRLEERYHMNGYYEIEVRREKDNATEIIFKRTSTAETKIKRIGRYVIRTDRLDLNAQDISRIHRSLTMIEDSFCSMKSELGLRPNFHHEDDPTAAHIHVTVIAYHMVCGILKKLQGKGINYNWQTIREMLSTHVRVTTTLNGAGQVINLRSNTTLTADQSRIYNALGIKQDPLGKWKIKETLTNVVMKKQVSKS